MKFQFLDIVVERFENRQDANTEVRKWGESEEIEGERFMH